MYGECELKARSAARSYKERFHAGLRPSYRTILPVVKCLRETDCVASQAWSGRRAKIGRQVQPDEVEAYVLAYPKFQYKADQWTLWPLKKSGLENPTRIMCLSVPTNASVCFTRRGCRATLFIMQLRHESDAVQVNTLGRCSVDGRDILFTKWHVQ